MIFVGTPEKGFFVEEYAAKEEVEFAYIPSDAKISNQTNAILKFGKQDYTIFDIEQYIDSSEVIATEIGRICSANNSKAIIFASGYNPQAEVIVHLLSKGYKLFILATNLSAIKDQFEKCLNGYMEASGLEEFKCVSLEENEEEVRKSFNINLIAVAGACHRIGTTTQAIQIVKYLSFKGYKACYVQMNGTSYIKDMREWYDIEENEDIGKITFENTDHYYKMDKISEILKLGYDYYIYDYGVYTEGDFNKISFLEKDIKIFVVGADPTEMPFTYNLIKNAFYDDVNYIFNYMSDKDIEDVAELMEEKAEHAFISPFVPNKYVLQEPEGIFEQIIPVETVMEDTDISIKRKKGMRFWKRKGGE